MCQKQLVIKTKINVNKKKYVIKTSAPLTNIYLYIFYKLQYTELILEISSHCFIFVKLCSIKIVVKNISYFFS